MDGSKRRIALICGAILLVGVLGYLALGEAVYYLKENVHHYESGALSALLALGQMQENYKADHGSYAADFGQLGVPLGAKLDQGVMSEDGPYRFRFGCIVRTGGGAVLEYCIQARPATYELGSRRSYLIDQTGRVHFTPVDRAAAMDDPVMSTH